MLIRRFAAVATAIAVVAVASSAEGQWHVSTSGGPPMAEGSGPRGLGVGVTCAGGVHTINVILPGEDLAGHATARWSDGSVDTYRFPVERGRLVGRSSVAEFRSMVDKLRRLGSVTLTVRRVSGPPFGDTISLRGSSRAIGQVDCGSPAPRRRASTPRPRPAGPPATEEDAQGVEVFAAVMCPDQIERLARYSSRWVDGWFEPKFSAYRWRDRSRGIVTYLGDRIEFQNGFGAWVPHVYECDIDVRAEAITDVRVRRGRLR